MANVARYDDLNTRAIGYAAFVSCIVLLIIILVLHALTSAWIENSQEASMANAHYTSSDNEISEQKARLAGYETQTVEITPVAEDGSNGEPAIEERFRIPVSRAKELVIEEFQNSDKDAPEA